MNITATLTRCRHGQALVQLESSPFNGMEIRPADLLQMAQQLVAIAEMANRLPLGGKHWKPSRIEIGNATSQETDAVAQGAKAVLDRMMKVIGTPEQDYSAALDISPNTVKTWINRGEVSLKFIRDFANKHGVSVDYLLGLGAGNGN